MIYIGLFLFVLGIIYISCDIAKKGSDEAVVMVASVIQYVTIIVAIYLIVNLATSI